MQTKKDSAPSCVEGFTIIELIVVIVIIAILAAIVLVSVTQYIQQSKVVAEQAEMRSLYKAAISYYSQNSTYSGVCSDPDFSKIYNALLKATGGVGAPACWDAAAHSPFCDSNSWFATIQDLSNSTTGNLICMDATGILRYGSFTGCFCGPSHQIIY